LTLGSRSGDEYQNDDGETNSDFVDVPSKIFGENFSFNKSSISSGTLQLLQDLLYSIERIKDQLITGLKDSSDVYSTNQDDYVSFEGRSTDQLD
jgi:hypothetical protein